MGGKFREGSGFRKGRRNMLFREDFGIRMGSCILRMNGMMLFMGSMMIIRNCRGVEGIVGNRWTRLDFGDGLRGLEFFFFKECLRLFFRFKRKTGGERQIRIFEAHFEIKLVWTAALWVVERRCWLDSCTLYKAFA